MAGGAAAGELSVPGPAAEGCVPLESAPGAARGHPGNGRLQSRPVVTPITRDDDGAVRALLRASVIPGAVRVAFTREPHYFAGDSLAGGEDHAVVARHERRLVGLGRCSVYPLFRNGAAARIGYLGALRVASGTPHAARLLRDGYARLAELVGEVDACFTSITSDNARARAVLERGGRLGLPTYTPIASLVTLMAPVHAGGGVPDVAAVDTAADADAGDAVAYLASRARDVQLALPWGPDRLVQLASHGFAADDLLVVRRAGTVVAAAGVWDQRPFRQVVVDGYDPTLQLARPAANLWLRLTRRPALPPPGSVLAQGAVLGAFVTAPDDWRALWPALQSRAHAKGLAWLAIARDARDPELPVLRALTRAREYHTTLYDVSLGGRSPASAWDGRLVRPEVALL